MKRIAIWAMLFFLSAFSAAYAGPQIVFYNIVQAPPTLELVSSNPQDHQTFDKSPAMAQLTFSQPIDPNRSDLKVFDPYNNPISTGLEQPRDSALKVMLPAKLLAGTYRIEWKAACACKGAQPLSGTSYFTVY